MGTVHAMVGSPTGKRIAAVAALAVLAAGGGTAAAIRTSSPPHAVSVPPNGRALGGGAALEVKSGTAILHVSVARLPGTLLRVSTPDSAPARPRLDVDAAAGVSQVLVTRYPAGS